MNALIRKESVEELCAHRARAIELYTRGFQALAEYFHRAALAADKKESDRG